MHTRALTLAISLLATAAVSVAATGCHLTCEDPKTEPIDLGIDTDLYAVADLHISSGDRYYAFLAVGAGGTVVTWGTDSSGEADEPFVDVFDLGDLDLRAAWIDRTNTQIEVWTWWVVGDGGLIMGSNNLGTTWNTIELPTTANLYGVAGIASHPIIVGDDTILWADVDGNWTELTSPTGSWGQLRGVSANTWTTGMRVDVVGLGGVIWGTDDPSGEWTLEPSGVTTDLFAVDYNVAVGAAGTMLLRDEDGWTRYETGLDVDLIDYDGGYALGANGEVYDVVGPGELKLIDTKPGARGVTNQYTGWVVVGDGGLASNPLPRDCR